MFRQFYPDEVYETVFDMDFENYLNNGYRAVLFDTDNTLVGHDAPADERAVRFIRQLKNIGLKVCIVSNNTEERVQPFAEAVGCEYEYECEKPKTEGFVRAMNRLGTTKEETFMVGDQLFTDIWGAKKTGIHAVFTKPLGSDPIFQIKLKRIGERIVFPFYRLYRKKHPAVIR